MAGADVRRFSVDRRGAALSYVFGVAHGALLTLAETLLYPTIVLTLFVAQLTDDPVQIALVPIIGTGVWLLPHILLGTTLLASRRQLPWAAGASIVQTSAIVLLAYIGYRADMDDDQRLRSFILCYAVYNLAAGLAAVPARELAVKAIPRERRGSFYAQRGLWGAVLAVGAGLVARGLLGPDGPAFPRNFTSMFAAAAAALAAATFFLMRMREPVRLAGTSPTRVATGPRHAGRAVGDPSFRRFLTFRVFLMASTLADPFLIVYARAELGLSTRYIGGYLIAASAARFLSVPLWMWVERRGGHRAVLQGAALSRLAVPLVALILPYLADTSLYRDRFDDNRPILYGFGLAFAAIGVSLGGQIRANFGYLVAIAQEEARPAYAWTANAFMVVASLFPLAGAALVERYSYDTLFATAAIVGLVAVFVSGVLTDTQLRTRPVAQAWRLRGARS